jgi:thiamine-monophosphate kinase
MPEFELIEKLRAILPGDGPGVRLGSGDDAAVTEPRGATATSVDAIVEGVHFTLPQFSPEAVGHKALAAALSDLAAMGAEAGEAYVVLGLPESAGEELCLGVAEGIAKLARRTGTAIAGGDITASPVLTVTVTAVGHEAPGSRLLSRAGARRGDVVAVTGELGGAAAALRLLTGGGAAAEPGAPAALLARQLSPEPRLAAGRVLADAGATAMIDVSDGLGADAGHVASAGAVRIEIEMASVPIQAGVGEVAGGPAAALEMAAGGGEDFELLACLPAEAFAAARAAVERAGVPLTAIGIVAGGSGVSLRGPDGAELGAAGYDHLAGA